MAQLFMLNVLLAGLWMFMWGLFDVWSLLAGMVVGYLLLGVISRTIPNGPGYGRKVTNLLAFGAYFMRILVKANLQVAAEVLTPGFTMTPRFVRYSVEGMTDLQITTLANSITLTPGTLSVDVLEDGGRYLLVHCMYAKDRQAAINDLDDLRDHIMKEVFS